MKAYSMDLPSCVHKDIDDGIKISAVAAKYTVSAAWMRRLKQDRAANSEITTRKRSGRSMVWNAHTKAIVKAFRYAPEASLADYLERFQVSMLRATWTWA